MLKSTVVLFMMTLSLPSFAAEVCLVNNVISYGNANGSFRYSITAECTEAGLESVVVHSRQSAGMARAQLIQKLLEKGYQAKTDEMFIKL